jgi:hypothetical protein
MSIIAGIGRLLRQGATNDLKHRIELQLVKTLTKLDIDYDDKDLKTIVDAILITIADWTVDGSDAIKDAFKVAMTDKPRKSMKNPTRG